MAKNSPKFVDFKAELALAQDRVERFNFVMKEIQKARSEARKFNPTMWVDGDVIAAVICAKNSWDIAELKETVGFYNEWIEARHVK